MNNLYMLPATKITMFVSILNPIIYLEDIANSNENEYNLFIKNELLIQPTGYAKSEFTNKHTILFFLG